MTEALGVGDGVQPVQIREKCDVAGDVAVVGEEEYLVSSLVRVLLRSEAVVGIAQELKVEAYRLLELPVAFVALPVGQSDRRPGSPRGQEETVLELPDSGDGSASR